MGTDLYNIYAGIILFFMVNSFPEVITMLLAQLISLPVSILLFIWMLSVKKNDPFPRGSVVSMLLSGALCTFLSTILTLLLGFAALILRIGPENIAELFADPSNVQDTAAWRQLLAISSNRSVAGAVRGAFLGTALFEELLKYLFMRICLRRPGVMKTRLDAVACAAIIGLAFQVVEDLYYASGSVLLAVFRALTPFHFVFGVIMGYYYGQYKVTGRKRDGILALLLPILAHGFYDSGIEILKVDDSYLETTLIIMGLSLALLVYVIWKLRRLIKDGTLSAPIAASQGSR